MSGLLRGEQICLERNVVCVGAGLTAEAQSVYDSIRAEDDIQLKLTPSKVIESTDYMGFYQRYN